MNGAPIVMKAHGFERHFSATSSDMIFSNCCLVKQWHKDVFLGQLSTRLKKIGHYVEGDNEDERNI